MAPLLTTESRAGQPIEFHGNTLVPINKVWQLKLPWLHGGLIWNRPASVVVRDSNDLETVVPIQDVTRQALWLLFGLSFASGLLTFLVNLRRRKQEKLKNPSAQQFVTGSNSPHP
jgi:hypothetical protein